MHGFIRARLHETEIELNPFEISNHFEKLFYLHGDFVAVTFQTTERFYIAHVQMILMSLLAIIKTNRNEKIKH